MDKIEELKKFKELLDTGVITEDEFNKKKAELLSIPETTSKSEKPKKEKKPINPKTKKAIVIALIALVVIAGALFGIKAAVNNAKTSKRNDAVVAHIQPIMSKYGISDYSVKGIHDGYNFFEVYAEGFENLSNGKAMDLLIELDSVSDLDDPCGGDKISFSSVNVYPGKDADYYYYRISTAWVRTGISNYKYPGIYSSYGMQCVYQCDN